MPRKASLPPFFLFASFLCSKAMDGPMILSRQAVEEFKRVYESEFGQKLEDDVAEEMALRFLRLFDLLSRSLASQANGRLSTTSF